jgi:hypothetical protein
MSQAPFCFFISLLPRQSTHHHLDMAPPPHNLAMLMTQQSQHHTTPLPTGGCGRARKEQEGAAGLIQARGEQQGLETRSF